MTFPEVKPGDAVLYVPDAAHVLDRDHRGDHLFEFEYVATGPMRDGKAMYQKGDRVNMGNVGSLIHEDGARRDPATGHIKTAGGHTIRLAQPKRFWQATVTAVKPDGKLDLRIEHPHGHVLDYPNVPYAATASLHSWHLSEGA